MFFYYDLFCLGDKRVFLADPDLIKHVAVTNSKNYLRTKFVRTFIPSIGNGVFSSNGKEHARQRKMINPAFNYNNLTGMVDDFKEVTSNLVKVRYKYYTVKVNYIFRYT